MRKSESITPKTATGIPLIRLYGLDATVSHPCSGPQTGVPPPTSTTAR